MATLEDLEKRVEYLEDQNEQAKEWVSRHLEREWTKQTCGTCRRLWVQNGTDKAECKGYHSPGFYAGKEERACRHWQSTDPNAQVEMGYTHK